MCPGNKGFISVKHPLGEKVKERLLLANFSKIYALFEKEHPIA